LGLKVGSLYLAKYDRPRELQLLAKLPKENTVIVRKLLCFSLLIFMIYSEYVQLEAITDQEMIVNMINLI
jgi:hypothetical protein